MIVKKSNNTNQHLENFADQTREIFQNCTSEDEVDCIYDMLSSIILGVSSEKRLTFIINR